MDNKHYHVTIGITEEEIDKMMEISGIFLSPEFKGIGIEVLPVGLMPADCKEFLQNYLKRCLQVIHLAKKNTH